MVVAVYLPRERRKALDEPVRSLAAALRPERRAAELLYVVSTLCEHSRPGVLQEPVRGELLAGVDRVARALDPAHRSEELQYIVANLLLLSMPASARPEDVNRYHAQNVGVLGLALSRLSGGLESVLDGVEARSEEAGALMQTLALYRERVLAEESQWRQFIHGDLPVFAPYLKKTLYLSHPTKERFFVRDEIQPQLEGLGVRIVNPFMLGGREHILYNRDLLGRMSDLIAEELKHTDPDEMVVMELGAIRRADGVFAYVPYQTMGTLIELWFNSNQLQRGPRSTFVLLDPARGDSYFASHPWLNTIATPTTDFEELKERILRWKEEAPRDDTLSDAEEFIRLSSLLSGENI